MNEPALNDRFGDAGERFGSSMRPRQGKIAQTMRKFTICDDGSRLCEGLEHACERSFVLTRSGFAGAALVPLDGR